MSNLHREQAHSTVVLSIRDLQSCQETHRYEFRQPHAVFGLIELEAFFLHLLRRDCEYHYAAVALPYGSGSGEFFREMHMVA